MADSEKGMLAYSLHLAEPIQGAIGIKFCFFSSFVVDVNPG
jgi:hypothetical protein